MSARVRGSSFVDAPGGTSEPKPTFNPPTRVAAAVTTDDSGDVERSCDATSHPGYPRGSSGEGWSGMAPFTHEPCRLSTSTRSPYSAWVGMWPTSAIRCAYERPANAFGSLGIVAVPGCAHTFATATATHAACIN